MLTPRNAWYNKISYPAVQNQKIAFLRLKANLKKHK